jgi:hypothetical protein
MSLPRFFDRAADAAAGAGSRLTAQVLADRLSGVTVELSIDAENHLTEAYLLAANLLSRLYPSLALTAPDGLRRQAEVAVSAINPGVELVRADEENLGEVFCLHLGPPPRPPAADRVVVDAAGWVAAVDTAVPPGLGAPAAPAALAAAALGVGEIFRAVFGASIDGPARDDAWPAVWDLVTSRRAAFAAAPDGPGWTAAVTGEPDIGTVHLAGAGAVGQAAVLTWRAARATGTLLPVDGETVDVGNLQRYVLTHDRSEGRVKTDILVEALAGTALAVRRVAGRWGEAADSGPLRDSVAVAVDTADARLAIAAGVHRRVYNAWTGPGGVGWSRHETFGLDEPCLACLYWPRGPQPSLHERIAAALGQHPLRIRGYLLPGAVLAGTPPVVPLPGQPLPDGAERWSEVSLLADLLGAGRIPASDADLWAERSVRELWHDGVCGRAVATAPGGAAVDVPLAHASALAGVMLAAQVLIAADPVLAGRRDAHAQGRADGAGALPEQIGRPKQPASECLCRDPAFRDAWFSAWGRPRGEVA